MINLWIDIETKDIETSFWIIVHFTKEGEIRRKVLTNSIGSRKGILRIFLRKDTDSFYNDPKSILNVI